MQRLSIIIPNYNYGQFIAAAIESALSLDWPDIEVIVVDDGSTDNSLDVVRGFGTAVRLLTQENCGPRVACNVGFGASTGDWIIFLDSDDTLSPQLALAIEGKAKPGVSKIQVQMQKIDRNGMVVSKPFPTFRPVPSGRQIRDWMQTTSSYPTPPGSGNVYARPFLESLFPLGNECGDASDSICLAAAPFLGDVVTVAEPLVQYRVHGNNRSYLLADTRRFTFQLRRAVQRQEFAQKLLGGADQVGYLKPLFSSRHILQLRVAEYRLFGPLGTLPGDGLKKMGHDAFAVLLAPGPETPVKRLAMSIWALGLLSAPKCLVPLLLRMRFQQ